MAVAMTIHSGGAVIEIEDSCCAGLSAEALSRRWAEVDREIYRINRNAQRGDAHEHEREESGAGR